MQDGINNNHSDARRQMQMQGAEARMLCAQTALRCCAVLVVLLQASVGVVGAPSSLAVAFRGPRASAGRPGRCGAFRLGLLSAVRLPCALPSGAACGAAYRSACCRPWLLPLPVGLGQAGRGRLLWG